MTLAIALAGGATATACGQGSSPGSPSIRGVPLAAGTQIVSQIRRCDGGNHPYCAVQLVVRGGPSRYRTSTALLAGEAARLRAAGWSVEQGDTDEESAAESPRHRLRVTYAIASADLESIDEGTITRATPIARSLSSAMFARAPTLSLMLQSGSS